MQTIPTQSISVVIPIYNGESCIERVVEELLPFTHLQFTKSGVAFKVSEIILVHDCGPNHSDLVIEKLASIHPIVRPIWLTKNYGQHPATICGMASASGDWVVTIDEDGQQNPLDIGNMLDMAVLEALQIVYARPTNAPPHGCLRNALSTIAKKTAIRLLGGQHENGLFNSYRLIDGEIARIIAAYCGQGIYLDIALLWAAGRVGYCPVELRREERPSSYNFPMLFNHFWRMIITSGTRPLRLITASGALSMIASLGIFLYITYLKLTTGIPIQGWASMVIVTVFFSGMIMISLGIVAEYLALTTGIMMGKPLYLSSSKPLRTIKKNDH